VNYKIGEVADDLADGVNYEFDDGYQHPVNYFLYYPRQPAEPLIAAETPPVAVPFLTSLLIPTKNTLDWLPDVFIDPFIDVVTDFMCHKTLRGR
jgi:hypothetical protein